MSDCHVGVAMFWVLFPFWFKCLEISPWTYSCKSLKERFSANTGCYLPSKPTSEHSLPVAQPQDNPCLGAQRVGHPSKHSMFCLSLRHRLQMYNLFFFFFEFGHYYLLCSTSLSAKLFANSRIFSKTNKTFIIVLNNVKHHVPQSWLPKCPKKKKFHTWTCDDFVGTKHSILLTSFFYCKYISVRT